MKFFRINIDEYDEILELQNGVCAGCGKPPKKKRLAVDHAHTSGLTRGLLCWQCNKILGMAKDNELLLYNLSRYLDNPPAIQALGERRYGVLGRAKHKKKLKYGPA